MDIAPLTDSNDIIDDSDALRARWDRDGVLYFSKVLDRSLVKWAEGKFRDALIGEDLIDPSREDLVWTGNAPKTRRPCDAIGTEVWHEYAKLPLLNRLMRIVLDDEPVWIPIVAHRNGMPTGPIQEGQDIFAARHQDSYFSGGMHYIVCWMPMRDAAMDEGSFAVAPGKHREGNFYDANHKMLTGAVADSEWRSANFSAGDVLIFDYFTPHSSLPNPSNRIRISMDMRAIAASAPQPVTGIVESVEGTEVSIRTESGELTKVCVSDDTYIRDMHPTPRVPTAELDRIAFPGASVMATVTTKGEAVMFRRNFY